MNKRLMVIPLIILTLGLVVTGCQSQPGVGTQTGSQAPDFELQSLDGGTVSLSGLRGTPVMLNFWASWCDACRYEMPFIQEVYEGWTGKQPSVVILAINIEESPSLVRQFMQDNNLSFPVLLDADASVAIMYDVSGIPVTFFIDKDGIIQERHLGAFSSAADIENSLGKIIYTLVNQ